MRNKKAKAIEAYYKWFESLQKEIAIDTIEPLSGGGSRVFMTWIFRTIYAVLSSSMPSVKYDGCLSFAWTFGTFLVGWAARTQLAKCHDPRRPLKDRRKGFKNWRENRDIVLQLLDDKPSELDKKLYDQKWSDPFCQKGGKLE